MLHNGETRIAAALSHYIYILRCRDGRYYTGYTTDLARRLKMHASGRGAKFTRAFGASAIVYHEIFDDKSPALRRECAIKQLSRSEKENLIRTNTDTQRLSNMEMTHARTR